MEALQKFSIPISIVIAGAMIAGALFYVNSNRAAGPSQPVQGQVLEKIRTVQSDDHILGNPDAKIVMVEFSDPECPFCKQFHETMDQIIKE